MSPTDVPSAKETVYEGPAVEMPWAKSPDGSLTSPGKPASSQETVYDGANSAVKKPDTSVARTATTKKVRWASLRFFVVATISFAEAFIYRDTAQALAFGALFVGVIFLTIGVFAFRLSRGAFLAGIVIYGLQTLQICFLMVTIDGGMFYYLKPLIVQCVILYRLYRAYGLLSDLHLLENE